MDRPNIVVILADDMGYGDIRSYNPESAIPTPHLDRMCASGMSFSDAHATSSVCSPSRYSLLTGEYNWRSGLKHGIVNMWDGPLIPADATTIGTFLQAQGYDTACIGKWHLGWDWPTLDGSHPNDSLPYGEWIEEGPWGRVDFGFTNIDFDAPITSGPIERGFDRYFGVDVPNYPPYAWIEDDHLTQKPTHAKPEHCYGDDGLAVGGWTHEEMLPRFAQRATEFIQEHANNKADPFFLYLPLTAPHSPIAPNDHFKDASGIGGYGDLVCEVDWFVGEILDALEEAGIAGNTLVIFTSDNGPEAEVGDDEGVYNRAARTGHFSAGTLRGIKRDTWEGGHRVPFVAMWPGIIPAATRSPALISLVDILATCADILDSPLPETVGRDTVSFLDVLQGAAPTSRESLVVHSFSGKFGIRRGPWMLIDSRNAGENAEPAWLRAQRGYSSDACPAQLFNLDEDPQQSRNLYEDHAQLVANLREELYQIQTPAPHSTAESGVQPD